MNEYLEKLYKKLGGDERFGSPEDFQKVLQSDKKVASKLYNKLGGDDRFGSFKDYNQTLGLQPQFEAGEKNVGAKEELDPEPKLQKTVPDPVKDFVTAYRDINKEIAKTENISERPGAGMDVKYPVPGVAESKEEATAKLNDEKKELINSFDFQPVDYPSVVNTFGKGEEDTDEVSTKSKVFLEDYTSTIKTARDEQLNRVASPELKEKLEAFSKVGVNSEDINIQIGGGEQEGGQLAYTNRDGQTVSIPVEPKDFAHTTKFLERQSVLEQQQDFNNKSIYKLRQLKSDLNINTNSARNKGESVPDAIIGTFEKYGVETPTVKNLKEGTQAEPNVSVFGASVYNTIERVERTGETMFRSLAEGYKSIAGEDDTEFNETYQKEFEEYAKEELDEEVKKLLYGTMPSGWDTAIEDNYVEIDGHRVLVNREGEITGLRRPNGEKAYKPSAEEKRILQEYAGNKEKYEYKVERSFRPAGWASQTTQVMTDMTPILLSTAATSGAGLPAAAGLTLGSFSVTYGSYYDEHFERTGDAGSAALYATVGSSLTAMLEGMGGVEASFVRRLGTNKTKQVISDVAAEAAVKNVTTGKGVMRIFGERLAKDNLGELATEVSQAISDNVLRAGVTGENINIGELGDELRAVIYVTPAATTPISAVTSTVGVQQELMKNFEIAARKKDKFNTVLDEWVESAQNEEQKNKREKLATEKRAIVDELSQTIADIEELDVPKEQQEGILNKSKQLALLKGKIVNSTSERTSSVLDKKIEALEESIRQDMSDVTGVDITDGERNEVETEDLEKRRDQAVQEGRAEDVQELEEEMKGRNMEFDSRIDEAVENAEQGVKTVREETTDEAVTEDIYNQFVEAGEVPQPVIKNIANKIKAGENLTEQEQSIRAEKSEEVEPILSEEDTPEYEGIFSTETTGLPSIDEIRGEDAQYFNFYKGKTADIEYMSPDEYLNTLRPTMGDIEAGITEQSAQRINEGAESGDKIDMPYLEYNEEGTLTSQEGRNRAVVAKQRGEKLIPVTVVKSIGERDKTELSKSLIDESIERGNTTKEDVLEDLQKNIHRDAYFFINNSGELDNYIESQLGELRARQVEETAETEPTEEAEQTTEPVEEVVEPTEQEEATEPEEGVEYLSRDIGEGEPPVIIKKEGNIKTPINEDQVPDDAEIKPEQEEYQSPEDIYTQYVQRLLDPANNTPEEIVEYIKKNKSKTQPRLSLDHIKTLADKAVEGVSTLDDIKRVRAMLEHRLFDKEVQQNDDNGWELLAQRLLAKRAEALGFSETAAEIEIDTGNAGRRYGRSIMTLRVMEDRDTLVTVMTSKLLADDNKTLNTENEVTGKTPLEQVREFIDKIKPGEKTVEEFIAKLEEKLPKEKKGTPPKARKRRKGTTVSATDVKANEAFENFKKALKEAKGYAGAFGNPKLFEAAFELMKYAYYKAKGSIENAKKIFTEESKDADLGFDADEVVNNKEFTKFREKADEEIAKAEQDRKQKTLERFSDRILSPKKGEKTAISELSRALATIKRNKGKKANSSIAEDIKKNGATIDELIEAKTIVEEKLEMSPADKAVILNEIDSIIEDVTDTAIHKSKVRKEIASGARDLNKTILDLAKDFYTQKKVKKDLVAEIIETTGLDKAEAQKYADQIEQAFDEIMADEVEKELKRELDKFLRNNLDIAQGELEGVVERQEELQAKENKTKEDRSELRDLDRRIEQLEKVVKSSKRRLKRATKSSPSIKKLVELVKQGVLSEKDIAYKFYDLFDLNELTKEDRKELTRLIREFENKKRDIDKKRVIHDITDFLQEKGKGMSRPEKLFAVSQEFAYLNMLSNPLTALKALAGNIYIFLTKHVPADFVNAVVQSIRKDPQVFQAYLRGLGDGFKGLYKAFPAIAEVIQTGRTSEVIFDIDSKILGNKKVVSEWIDSAMKEINKPMPKKEGTKEWTKAMQRKAGAYAKSLVLAIPLVQGAIVRGLIAMDVMSKSFVIPYLRNKAAMWEVLRNGYDKNSVGLVEEVDKLVGKDNSLRRAVIEDSQEQGFIKPVYREGKNSYVGVASQVSGKPAIMPELDSDGNKIPYSEYRKTKEYKEGAKQKEKYERTRYNELLPEFSDNFINEEANTMAEEMAMQGTVFGGVGRILNPLIDFKKKSARGDSTLDKAGSLFLTMAFPFMRVSGVGWNLIKGATPFNVLQIARNEEGHWDRDKSLAGIPGLQLRTERRKWNLKGVQETRKISEYEKFITYSYATIPTVLVSGLAMALFDMERDDEEGLVIKLDGDRNWRITGGDLPYSEVGKNGYEYYAIQYYNEELEKWENILKYDDIPLGVLLAGIGNASDKLRTNPKTDRLGVFPMLQTLFTGSVGFVGDFGWASTFGVINTMQDVFTGLVSDDKSKQENYQLEQLSKKAARPFAYGGALASYANSMAIIYGDKVAKEGSPNVPYLGTDVPWMSHIYKGWSDSYSNNILTSWMYENERVDAYGQPYEPDLNNRMVIDFLENMIDNNLEEVTSGWIAPKRESPEYVKALNKFERASEIGTYYPYKSSTKTRDDIEYFIIEDIPPEVLDNMSRGAALNIKVLANKNLEDIKKVPNHAEMIKMQKDLYDVAKSHAWSEEMLKILEKSSLWDVRRVQLKNFDPQFGINDDGSYYDSQDIKDYIFEKGLKVVGDKVEKHDYTIRMLQE